MSVKVDFKEPPEPPTPRYLDVVLTRGPGPESDFVELEDERGRSVGAHRAGWIDRGDGLAVLRIFLAPPTTEAAEDWADDLRSIFDERLVLRSMARILGDEDTYSATDNEQNAILAAEAESGKEGSPMGDLLREWFDEAIGEDIATKRMNDGSYLNEILNIAWKAAQAATERAAGICDDELVRSDRKSRLGGWNEDHEEGYMAACHELQRMMRFGEGEK